MVRIAYALLVGLLGAAIVHIAVILLLPSYAPQEIWTQLGEGGELYEVVPLTGEGAVPLVADGDPLFQAVACRYDLDNGGLHLTATETVPFWSMSLRDRAGQTTYSLTDRTLADGSLDIAVVSAAQMADFRRALPPELEGSIFVESPTSEGIAVVRVFVPDESWTATAERFFETLSCQPFLDPA
jgi:uncharacterized membrane protein